MECECLSTCPFFHDRMRRMPTTTMVLKQRYCEGDWASCARCMVVKALGRDSVPSDLYPDQQRRAAELISQALV